MTVQELATYAFLGCVATLWVAAWLVRRVNRFRRRHRGAIGFVAGLFAGRAAAKSKAGRPLPPIPDNALRPTCVYRHWGRYQGRPHVLLYVGITDCARGGRRWLEHEADKPWFVDVEHSEISDPYPTRGAALYAEAVAIRDERPVYNIQRPNPESLRRRAS